MENSTIPSAPDPNPRGLSPEEALAEVLRERESASSSPEGKIIRSWVVWVEHLYLFVTLAFLTAPASLYAWKGESGAWAGILPVVMGLSFLKDLRDRGIRFRPGLLFPSLQVLIAAPSTWLALGILGNSILFFRYPLRTLITPEDLALFFAVIFLGFFLLWKFGKAFLPAWSTGWIAGVLTPGLLNLFFLANWHLAKNEGWETHFYQTTRQQISLRGGRSRIQSTNRIVLENVAYEDYPQIRMFWDAEPIGQYTRISYQFADGPFGWVVLKKFQFGDPPRP